MPTVINKNNKQSAANDGDVGGKAAVGNDISKKVTKGKINFWYEHILMYGIIGYTFAILR